MKLKHHAGAFFDERSAQRVGFAVAAFSIFSVSDALAMGTVSLPCQEYAFDMLGRLFKKKPVLIYAIRT